MHEETNLNSHLLPAEAELLDAFFEGLSRVMPQQMQEAPARMGAARYEAHVTVVPRPVEVNRRMCDSGFHSREGDFTPLGDGQSRPTTPSGRWAVGSGAAAAAAVPTKPKAAKASTKGAAAGPIAGAYAAKKTGAAQRKPAASEEQDLWA